MGLQSRCPPDCSHLKALQGLEDPCPRCVTHAEGELMLAVGRKPRSCQCGLLHDRMSSDPPEQVTPERASRNLSNFVSGWVSHTLSSLCYPAVT